MALARPLPPEEIPTSLGEDGVTEIWGDGKKTYTQQGCNVFYYRSKFAFKFGMYGTGSPGAIYFDAAKVVTGSGSYEQVSTGGEKAAENPSQPKTESPRKESR